MNHKEMRRERVSGGKSWADAVFRMNATSRAYARCYGQAKIREMGLAEVMELHDAEDLILLARHGVPVLVLNYDFVENKRREGVLAYEEWLENKLKALME